MLQWLLFNLCVNNHDAHGKNYSFFVSKAGLMPTPGTIWSMWGFTPSSTSIWPWPSATSLLLRRSTHGSCWRWPRRAAQTPVAADLAQDGQRHTASAGCRHRLVETDNPAELAYLARYRDDVERRCHHFQAQATLLPELQL
jgi:serine/threonine-protein kinase HipA